MQQRTSCRSWFLVCQRVLPPVFPLQHPWHLQGRKLIILRFPQAHLLPTLTGSSDSETGAQEDLSGIDSYPVTVSSKHVERKERGDLYRNGCKNSGKILWMTVPEHRDSHASSSHESSLVPTSKRSEDLGKHSVKTHFPKDRNCEICQRTKITRAPCRRRNGEAVPRAANFGDLITVVHKVLSDNCESRNNYRYAVVVQDLATQWIQSFPCKTKTSQEAQRSLQKFLEPNGKPKVIYTDNSLEFGKACEDLSWEHCTSTPHRLETNGISERAVRRVKEGTSAVLLQSGLDENGGQILCNALPICETFKISCLIGNSTRKSFWKGPIIPFGSLLECYLISSKDHSRIHQFWKESFTWIVLWIRSQRIWKGDMLVADIQELETMDASEIDSKKKTHCKGSNTYQRKWKIHFSSRRWTSQSFWKRRGTENTHLDREHPIRGESRKDFLGESEGSLLPPQDSLAHAGEAKYDFWSMSGSFIYRHHVEPRVELYSSREESFPIPPKYIDVSRTTQTNLDVMQDRRIHDYRNINGSRDLSDSWTGFTQVVIKWETYRRIYVVWREKWQNGR